MRRRKHPVKRARFPRTREAGLKDTVKGIEKTLLSFNENINLLEENIKVQNFSVQLYEELEEYKGDTLFELRKTMLGQLVELRETLKRLINSLRDKEDSYFTKDEFFKLFDAFENNILQNIRLLDIDVSTTTNVVYDRKIHKIMEVIPTDDEGLNNVIESRISQKYMYENKVLFREKVRIYKTNSNRNEEK